MTTLLIVLAALWGLAFVAVAIWNIVRSFQADVLLTLGSFICGVFGIILLVKHWDTLKHSFAAYCVTIIAIVASVVGLVVCEQADQAEAIAAQAAAPGPLGTAGGAR